MIRVREEVESAREKEFEDIAHLSAFSFAHICWLSCANRIYISQPMPIFSPEGDRGPGTSARCYRIASESYVNFGAAACPRGQDQ
jgi:hypothetical protein